MSTLLKQDTFYNEYGDPGRIYPYPDRVSVHLDGFSGRVFFDTVSQEVSFSMNTVPFDSLASRTSEFPPAPGVIIEGSTRYLFSVASESTTEIMQITGDFQNKTLFADFYYQQQEDTPVTLNNHQFVLTGG